MSIKRSMKNNLKLNKHHFYNFPQLLTKADYLTACDLIIADLRKNPELKAVYLAGQDWLPGISDIDIVAVYQNDFNIKQKIGASEKLSSEAKFILLHGYLVFDERNFKNWFYLGINEDEVNLRLVYGKSLMPDSPKKELSVLDYKFLEAIIIFGFLVNKLLIAPRYLRYSKVDVRKLICEMNSLKFTLNVLDGIMPGRIKTNFVLDIEKLRNDWFEERPEKNLDKLTELFNQYIDLVLEITILLNQFLKDNLESANLNLLKQNLIFKNNQYHISFIEPEKWEKELYLDNFLNNNAKYDLILPFELSYFFLAYASEQGGFSSWIRQNLINYEPAGLLLNTGIKKHIRAMNMFMDSEFVKKGNAKIPFAYGFQRKKRFLTRLFIRLKKR